MSYCGKYSGRWDSHKGQVQITAQVWEQVSNHCWVSLMQYYSDRCFWTLRDLKLACFNQGKCLTCHSFQSKEKHDASLRFVAYDEIHTCECECQCVRIIFYSLRLVSWVGYLRCPIGERVGSFQWIGSQNQTERFFREWDLTNCWRIRLNSFYFTNLRSDDSKSIWREVAEV